MAKPETILLVEDDETIALGIKVYFEKYYEVVCTDTIAKAKQVFENTAPDLVLLDWNLPDGNGLELFSLFKGNCDIPVIFLTVRDDERDIVQGLDMGADDYIVKPFKLSVLQSRIKAVLRRSKPSGRPGQNLLSCCNVQLFRDKTLVLLGDKELPLTAGEYRLLLMLLENKNRTLTRSVLLDRLWDIEGEFVNDNTLTVTMKRLREKLGNPAFIKTIRGIGYRVEDEDEQ